MDEKQVVSRIDALLAKKWDGSEGHSLVAEMIQSATTLLEAIIRQGIRTVRVFESSDYDNREGRGTSRRVTYFRSCCWFSMKTRFAGWAQRLRGISEPLELPAIVTALKERGVLQGLPSWRSPGSLAVSEPRLTC